MTETDWMERARAIGDRARRAEVDIVGVGSDDKESLDLVAQQHPLIQRCFDDDLNCAANSLC